MTRASKKQDELRALNLYLKARGLFVLPENVISQERPDFLLHIEGKIIGVELTNYHVPGGRRQVEEQWNRLREWPLNLIDYPKHRSVKLNFKKMHLPSTSKLNSFVSEIIQMTSGEISSKFTTEPDPTLYPIAAAYLNSIAVEPVSFPYKCWDWNYNAAWVGASQDELITIVDSKQNSVQIRNEYGENWLMIVSGSSLSRITAIYDHETLQVGNQLTEHLDRNIFDRMILLQSPIIEWDKKTGWRTIRNL